MRLQNDTKEIVLRKQSRNDVARAVFKMASNYECDIDILPEFRDRQVFWKK